MYAHSTRSLVSSLLCAPLRRGQQPLVRTTETEPGRGTLSCLSAQPPDLADAAITRPRVHPTTRWVLQVQPFPVVPDETDPLNYEENRACAAYRKAPIYIARSARLDSVALPPMCTTTILYASTGRCTHQLSFVHLLMPRARSLLAATTFIMWRGPSCRCRRHRRHRSHRSHRLRLHCLCNHHLQRHHHRLQRRCRRLGRHYYHRLPHRSTLHHHLSPSRHRRQEYGQC